MSDEALTADGLDGDDYGDLPRHGRRFKILWGVAVAVVAIIVLVVVLGVTSGGSGAKGPSVGSLDASIKSLVAQHWHPSGLATVSCVEPSSWTAGAKFTCYAYNSKGTGLGTAYGTLLPGKNGQVSSYNLQWVP